jgi:hypothetical protein
MAGIGSLLVRDLQQTGDVSPISSRAADLWNCEFKSRKEVLTRAGFLTPWLHVNEMSPSCRLLVFPVAAAAGRPQPRACRPRRAESFGAEIHFSERSAT